MCEDVYCSSMCSFVCSLSVCLCLSAAVYRQEKRERATVEKDWTRTDSEDTHKGHNAGCCLGRACELGELGLEERDDGGVLVVLGVGKGSVSIGRNEARITSSSEEDLNYLHMAILTR